MDPLFNPANVLTDQLVSGPDARPDAPADWLIEIPHGATRRAHFEALAPQLKSALPDGLIDFFFVNTDAGAPELAFALAERLVAARPTSRRSCRAPSSTSTASSTSTRRPTRREGSRRV